MSDDNIPGRYDASGSAVGAQDVDAPSIVVANQVAQIGAAFNYTPTIADLPAGGAVTVSLWSGTLPDGLTLNTSTGEISGTTTTEEVRAIVLRVVDGAGNATLSASFTIASEYEFWATPNNTFTESFEYAGGWEGTLPAIPDPDFSLAESTFTESFEVDWDGVPASFAPAAPPGAPFADYNAQSLSVGAVASWTNEGSDATGDLTVNPGSTGDPTCAVGDGPVSGARYVSFDKTGSGDALQGALTTTRATGVVFAAIVRIVDEPDTTTTTIFDGDDATNRMILARRVTANGGDWRIDSGSTQSSGAKTEVGKWVRVVGRFGSSGLCSVERATRVSANSGANSLDGITVGASYAGAQPNNIDVARLCMWDDGTTPLEAERWLEAEYPFAAVPPGNPVHWYDPGDYAIGSVSTLTDKGSGVDDLTCTDLSVIDDTECPGVNVFSFNGTTSRAVDDGTVTTAALPVLISANVRPTHDSVDNTVVGDSATTANACALRMQSTNAVRTESGAAATFGLDYDTVDAYATRLRWSVIDATFVSSGNAYAHIDDVEGSSSTTSSYGVDSIALGCDWSGATYQNFFQGRMGQILIYGGDANEANRTRAGEVQEWLQRHNRLATMPGAPFFDVDAESIAQADATTVASWTNGGGTGGNLVQATEANKPVYRDNGGPETDAPSYVYFDMEGSTQWMDSASAFTALTQPIVAVNVYRVDVSPSVISFQVFGSDNAATNVSLLTDTVERSVLNAGANVIPSSGVSLNEWHGAVFIANGASSQIDTTDGKSTSGNAGTETHGTKHRIGWNTGTTRGEVSMHRSIGWDDGTSFAVAKKFLEMRYPGVDPY